MSVNLVSGANAALSQASTPTGQSVGIAVLKKALDVQAQGAAQLLQALPTPAANPPHLGQRVDTYA